MKITLDIPDSTICAFFNFVRGDWSGLTMQSHSIQSIELKDGAIIKIEASKEMVGEPDGQ